MYVPSKKRVTHPNQVPFVTKYRIKEARVRLPFLSHSKVLSRKLWINLQLCLDLDGGRGGTVEPNRKGCDIFLRKEKRHSDELEKVVMKAKINFHSLTPTVSFASQSELLIL